MTLYENNGVIRVLMVGPSLDSQGGISSFERISLEALSDSRSVEVDFHPSVWPGSKIKKLFYGIRSLVLYWNRLSDYDVVHINFASGVSSYRKRIYLSLAKVQSKKVVVHSHGSALECRLKDRDESAISEMRSVTDGSDLVIVLSEEWKNILISIGIPPYKVKVLNNAVHVPESVGRRRTRRLNSQFDILYLGRIDSEKGVDDLVEAIARVSESEPDIHIRLIVAGSGSTEVTRSIAEMIDVRGIDAKLCGWVDGEEKAELLECSDLFVLPSHREVLPIALLEAMGAGLPCVATNVGAISTVIDNGKNGLIVESGSPRELANAIRRYVNDPSLYERSSLLAIQTVKSAYSVTYLRSALEKIYLGVMDVSKEA